MDKIIVDCRNITPILIVIMLVMVCFPPVHAADSGFTYTYNADGSPLPLREAYRHGCTLTGGTLGISGFKRINGLYVKGDLLYICDSGNNRIVVVNK